MAIQKGARPVRRLTGDVRPRAPFAEPVELSGNGWSLRGMVAGSEGPDDTATLTPRQIIIFIARVVGIAVDRMVFRQERGHGPGYWITNIAMQVVLGIGFGAAGLVTGPGCATTSLGIPMVGPVPDGCRTLEAIKPRSRRSPAGAR